MLIWRIALRELRGGIRDFRIFLGCLIVGVAVIAAVGTVSRHIEKGITNESRTLLGGDIEITLSNTRVTPEQLKLFESYGSVSLTVNLRAMATFGDNTTLVELKGVDDAYPLLGEARLSHTAVVQQAFSGGRVVVEKTVLDRLGVKQGDPITLGINTFTIADVLEKEPDSITNPLSLGPRIMANVEQLEKNGFLMAGNLIRYHYHLLLKDPQKLDDFKLALQKNYPGAPWIIKTSNDNNRGIQDFIGRLQLFMTLAGLSTLLIGGIGIMNATETYLSRKSEDVAVMKTLGASRNFVFCVYVIILFLITLGGSFTGAIAGSLLSSLVLPYLAGLLPVFDAHFSFDIYSVFLSMGFGILTVFTFSIAALGRGIEVRPALLFRGIDPERPPLTHGKRAINILLAIGLIATLIGSAGDKKIALGFIASALLSFMIFALSSRFTKKLARKIHLHKPWARLAIANLYRQGSHTLSIMLSTGIGLTVLIALLLVEGNFQHEVDDTMPAVAPSLFLIDIQPPQKDAFMEFLRNKPYVSDLSYQPMIRGRIAKLNGIPVEQARIDSDAKWAVESDRGITFAAVPPDNAKIAEGQWWAADYSGAPLVSLDRRLAEGMGLHIGDTLAVNILGQEVEAKIANLRDVNYISFQINFSMIFSPGAMEKFPQTYISTVHIDNDADEAALTHELAKQFPNISTIRIKDSILQIKEIIDHIAVALRLCALVTLFSGVLVLASALAATLDKRIYDTVVLKVLGACKSDIIKMFLTEWLLLASITALISCALGSAGAWLILRRLDWMEFQLIPGAIAATVGLSLGFITITGFIIHTRIFNIKAATILRNE